jgi:hypothetical protein
MFSNFDILEYESINIGENRALKEYRDEGMFK